MTVRTIDDLTHHVEEAADFVVVGSGAAGATSAWKLAQEGFDVVLVEEGPPKSRQDFTDQMYPAMASLYREGGLEAMVGRSAVATLQGRVLGGTPVVNSAIAWRLPEPNYDRWAADPAIRAAFPLDDLHRHWDVLDEKMHVTPTALEVAGRGNTLAALGADRLGIKGKVMNRYTDGCKGAGRCQQGCPNDAKMSTALTLIPEALDRGMAVLTHTLATRVRFDATGRAIGVDGLVRDPVSRTKGPRVRLHARRGVVLAPGCIQMPGLLRESGFRHPLLGKYFQCHPGTGFMPVFDEEVQYYDGATQGWESDHFFDEGLKFEVVNVPPEVNAGRVPGIGRELAHGILDMGHFANWGVLCRSDAHGTVRGRPGRSAVIRYTPSRHDMTRLRKGLHWFAKIAFEAGAKEILTGVHGLPARLAPHEVDLVAEASLDPRSYTLVATHLFGTARASGDEHNGVCDPQLQPWGTKNLWLVDSSVFPTNIGVNPQHMIQAVALHATERIAAAR